MGGFRSRLAISDWGNMIRTVGGTRPEADIKEGPLYPQCRLYGARLAAQHPPRGSPS